MKKILFFLLTLLCLGQSNPLWSMSNEDILDPDTDVLTINKTQKEIYQAQLRDSSLEDFELLLKNNRANLAKEGLDTITIFYYLANQSSSKEQGNLVKKINYLKIKITAADPSKNNVKFNSPNWDPIINIILLHYGVPNSPYISDIQEWIPWLAERGAPLNNRNEKGKTPLSLAIGYKQPKLVQALLKAGAKPSVTYKEGSEELTALELAKAMQKKNDDQAINKIIELLESYNRLDIAAPLKNTSKDNFEEFDLITGAMIKNFNSKANPDQTPKMSLQEFTKSNQPVGAPTTTSSTPPGISSTTQSSTTQPTTPQQQAFTRAKAMWATLVTALSLSALYTWLKKSSYPEKQEDTLINNTDKPIWVSYHYSNYDKVNPGMSYSLSGKEGTLINIKVTSKGQAYTDLSIDISKYSNNRINNHLNLIISKNWLSWLFGPISASARWIPKE